MTVPNAEVEAAALPDNAVVIDYTNWRGERAVRCIMPCRFVFSSNEWHPKPQWLLEAVDFLDKREVRTYALANIHAWGTEAIALAALEASERVREKTCYKHGGTEICATCDCGRYRRP